MHMVDSVMDYGLLEEEEKWALLASTSDLELVPQCSAN